MRPGTLTLLLLAAALPACGGGTVSMEDFIAQYPDAYCAYHLHCCAVDDEQSYNSPANCSLMVRQPLESLLGFRISAAHRATFNGVKGQDCLDRLAGKDCSDPSLVKGCAEEAVIPHQAQGQPCAFSAECQTYFCDQPQTGVEGVCGGPAIVGGKCSGDHRACPPGSYCSASAICTDQAQAGATCSDPHQCLSFICLRGQKLCADASRSPICQGK